MKACTQRLREQWGDEDDIRPGHRTVTIPLHQPEASVSLRRKPITVSVEHMKETGMSWLNSWVKVTP